MLTMSRYDVAFQIFPNCNKEAMRCRALLAGES